MIGNITKAQITGISGNKISSFSYDPVPQKKVEFEPTLSASFAKAFWANDGDKQPFIYDQFTTSSSINWRITYGLNKRTELGLSVPNNFSNINLATKIWLTDNDKINLSAMLGYALPLGSVTYSTQDNKHISYSTIGYGVVASFKFDDKNQLDVNLQAQNGFNQFNPPQLFINVDFGSYFLRDDLFLIFGTGYQQSLGGDLNTNKLTIYPGLALETGKQFLFVLNSQHDLFGRNNFKTWGLSLALTTSIF